jgi:hypothetical protein
MMIPITTDTRWRLGKSHLTLTPIEQMWALHGKIDRPCSGCLFLHRAKIETICHCEKSDKDAVFHGHDPACGLYEHKAKRPVLHQAELVLED